MAFSTSMEYTFSPPVTIMSFIRSVRCRRPSSSMKPMSPVRYQPSRITASVSAGFRQYRA